MTVILATGTSSADALSGGAFCGHKGSVFLMTRDNATSENYTIQNNIIPNKNAIDQGYLFGASDVLVPINHYFST